MAASGLQGSGSALLPLFALPLLLALQYATATQHMVGGSAGWTVPGIKNVNYTTWADSSSVFVGDTLVFTYNKDYHNVDQVSKADFESCNDSKRLAHYVGGNTVIQLNETGTFYFICGVTGHCSAGQKVQVVVKAAEEASTPSPLLAPTPFSASSPAGASTPSSTSLPLPSPSPSPSSSASASSSGTNSSAPAGPAESTNGAAYTIKFMATLLWSMGAVCFFWIVV